MERRTMYSFLRRNLELAGVLDGETGFVGPELLQIDLTNNCNNNCIACWCRSPLLQEQVISPELGAQTLPLELVKKTLDDCARMGTVDIYLAGGGEPFMHPDIMEILAYIKKLGFRCHLNTNFTLVDRERAATLNHLGVDNLIVSLWAATPASYVASHSNQTEATFERITDTITHLANLKKGGPPHIKLYNVIMSKNYHEVVEMAEFAHRIGADAVEYTPADIIPGYTDELLLNEDQRRQVLDCETRLQELDEEYGGRPDLWYREFMRRLSGTGASMGEYDQLMLTDIPCNIGWNFSRILADGNVNACLKAHRIPVGNIHEESFRSIWNGRLQKEFRQKTRTADVTDPFFTMIGNDEGTQVSQIGCHRGCDDIDRNRRLQKRLEKLSLAQRLILKGVGRLYRMFRT